MILGNGHDTQSSQVASHTLCPKQCGCTIRVGTGNEDARVVKELETLATNEKKWLTQWESGSVKPIDDDDDDDDQLPLIW